MQTLNASTGIAQGSVTAVESISLSTFWGRLSTRGIDISFIDFFLCIRCQYLPSAWVFPTKSTSISFLGAVVLTLMPAVLSLCVLCVLTPMLMMMIRGEFRGGSAPLRRVLERKRNKLSNIRRLYLRGFRPPTTDSMGVQGVTCNNLYNIRRLYLPTVQSYGGGAGGPQRGVQLGSAAGCRRGT